MTPTIAEQKQLMQKIKQLRCRKCYIEIFRCIVSTKTPYTQNKNGIFFNLTKLSPDTFTQVRKIVSQYQPPSGPAVCLGSQNTN